MMNESIHEKDGDNAAFNALQTIQSEADKILLGNDNNAYAAVAKGGDFDSVIDAQVAVFLKDATLQTLIEAYKDKAKTEAVEEKIKTREAKEAQKSAAFDAQVLHEYIVREQKAAQAAAQAAAQEAARVAQEAERAAAAQAAAAQAAREAELKRVGAGVYQYYGAQEFAEYAQAKAKYNAYMKLPKWRRAFTYRPPVDPNVNPYAYLNATPKTSWWNPFSKKGGARTAKKSRRNRTRTRSRRG